MNIKTLLYWLITFLIIYLLWPILKWLILIVIVLCLGLFLYLKKKTKVFTNIKWTDEDMNDDYFETVDRNIESSDVIDVEYKEKDIDK